MARKDLISIFIMVLFSLLYIVTPVYHDSGESFYSAVKIEMAERDGNALSLFNAHKPFYHMAVFALYKAVLGAFPGATALGFLKIFNLVIGLLTLWLFFLLIRTVVGRSYTALYSTLFMGFFYVFWYSSHEAGGSILVLLMIVVYLFFLFKLHTSVPTEIFHIILGVVLGLILILDFTAVILIIPTFFYNPYGKDYQLGFKFLTLGVAVLLLIVGFGIFYTAIGLDNIDDFSKLLVKGLEVNYFTGKEGGVFQLEAASALKPLTLTGSGMIAGRESLSPIFQIIAGILFTGILIIAIIKWKDYENKEKDLTLFSFAWLIPMLIFFALWSSAAMQSSLYWILPMAIIFGITVFGGKWVNLNRTVFVIGTLLLAVILCGNLATAILPATSTDSNPSYKISEWMKKYAVKDDLVLFFETENESYRDSLFWFYMPFEAKRKTFTINWSTSGKDEAKKISAVLDQILESGAKLFLLVREDLEQAVTVNMFKQRYPVYDSALLEKGAKYSIYSINK
jgi:4-amino-4-deoxy-L-arabinose transferase-like glycosyltransferase